MQTLGLVANYFFTTLAFTTTTCFGLHSKSILHQNNLFIDVCCDLCVFMKTKCLWLWIQRKLLDVIDVIFFISWFNNFVQSTLRERMTDSYGFFANVSFKNGFDEEGIFIISYTTTVVYDCTKVVEYFIWYYFVLFYE